MIYHFKIHKEHKGYWAECIEIDGCSTQGDSVEELLINAAEALNLLLDEPENSQAIFPLPNAKQKNNSNIFEVEVDPSVAFAFLMRRTRLLMGLTQNEMKEVLQFKTLFSYQKLERSKYANPTLKSLKRIKDSLPEFPIHQILGR
jgi:predicted RNase H-like HicB family nuclease